MGLFYIIPVGQVHQKYMADFVYIWYVSVLMPQDVVHFIVPLNSPKLLNYCILKVTTLVANIPLMDFT